MGVEQEAAIRVGEWTANTRGGERGVDEPTGSLAN